MHTVNTAKPYLLYIEDDADDVELLKYTLAETRAPFEVVHISDGDIALNFLEQAKQYGRLPELIFLDVNLMNLNGKETLLCLKADKELGKIPAVILSASNHDPDINYFRNFQVPYIVKPGDVNRFKEEVTDVMKRLLAYEGAFSASTQNIDAA
jgi:CheY-like chemotaxis protein